MVLPSKRLLPSQITMTQVYTAVCINKFQQRLRIRRSSGGEDERSSERGDGNFYGFERGGGNNLN